MRESIPVSEIHAAGGLQKWIEKQGRAVIKQKLTTHKESLLVHPPQAKGRLPANKLLGFDAERMNRLEAKYAEHLENQRLAGRISLWRFGAVKFRLADRTWYEPDFYVLRPDGAMEIHETKGHWEDDARVKIKATAESFPEFHFLAVQLKRGEWQIERFRAGKEAA